MSKEIESHELYNKSGNEPFTSVMERRLSRRSMMRGSLNVAALSMFAGFGVSLAGCSDDDDDNDTGTGGGNPTPEPTPITLGFESIAGSKTDAIVVPPGYSAQVLIPWGTPLNDLAPEWSENLAFTPTIQENSVGMHHDGMYFFPLSEDTASNDFILALNNEYIDQGALWAPQNGPTAAPRPADEVRTEINAHGITLVRIQKQSDGSWSHVKNSSYNRRITSSTPMRLSGPVAGSDYVITPYSPSGTMTRGTNNNCAMGYTPWGTYLTCEENWPGYFIKDSGREKDDDRLGIETGHGRYYWETAAGDGSEVNDEFGRFNATPTGTGPSDDYRNEPRTFGYVVEIDPYTGTAVKRTHLGRFRHEGCWLGKLVEGEPVVFYSGHDSRNEYIYKFVSAKMWSASDESKVGSSYDRLDVGNSYLDEGTLYVAKFNDNGTGEWIALTPDAQTPGGSTLAAELGLGADDLAGIIIHTCDAADIMGGTPMDRPEWASVDPASGMVYMTLTNNSKRTEENTAATYTNGGSAIEEAGVGFSTAPTNGPNPRASNNGGQVVRWLEASPGATEFEWEVFVFGAAASDTDNLSGLTDMNQFASPDGLWYDQRDGEQGILWIQTDNGYSNVTDYTNDQMLAVVPSSVAGESNSPSIVDGRDQSNLKRFLVGPNGCEITGVFANADKTAIFVNVQHPGNWPSVKDATVETAGSVRPRASTVVIWKDDGGQVGV
ncbi:PhoX family phosphatase [Marinobacter nanhaiticus D15-8W]|uniref:PhoX family phosphatase n=1 Tax=Marinobacter nanhaiticus D15-8W TaxID=626887 RepID=N6WMU1_9GAMM|nr:PhoX family phosphatase [Marinobacter nanhaiticus]ENO12781.1 PhoX family phosphatase [Marinobacter nanhaiticus D15-8W]BES70128.1 PhoX family phosphatase [Marinobacter nanhaiticus D15-8W]